MTLLLRSQKGSALTNDELDNNFVFLGEEINDVRSDVDAITSTTIPELIVDTASSLDGKQPLTARLTSLSGLSGSGLAVVSGDSVFARSIVSNSSNLIVTNGTGVDGNPTIDLSSSVATVSGTQTFTGKTISGSSNTITNVSLATGVTGVLPLNRGGTGSTTAAEVRAAIQSVIDPTGTGLIVKQNNDVTVVRSLEVSGVGLGVQSASGVTGNPTITSNATSSNTSGTLVSRDGSGNFAAGVITATLNGNASTVTNGVYANISYSNPTWITSLAGSKVTSIPNTSLQNSSITINGVTVALGASANIVNPVTIPGTSTANQPNTIALRDASGNFVAGTITGNLIGNVAGVVTGTLLGNASTVTNGVYSTGSYSNPAWITSLAGSKVTSIPNSSLQNSTITINGDPVSLGGNLILDTNTGTPDNIPSAGVRRNVNGDFAAGVITANLLGSVTGNVWGNVFGNVVGNVTGNITGNAASVTNGVYANVSYSNPTWITSLAGSKVTSIPNSSLQNSTITINGNTVALGGSTSITIDNGVSTNTANRSVVRDNDGNFAAGVITANLLGNVTGNVTGNAGTVTDGVYTTGSYSNPAWITSLAGSKVTSIPNTSLQNSSITINGSAVALGGSATLNIDNGVSTNTANRVVARDSSGNFAAGVITANLVGNVNGNLSGNVSGNVTGNVTGNAGSVTNGVYITGSYSNPTWITSLAGSKVTNIPNTSLQNSTITINGTAVALGGSTTLNIDNGTPVPIANRVVARDDNGNFFANSISANLFGNVVGNVTGNVTGNAGSVTDGVYTTGSYSNPVWITSLAGSKVTSIPNTSLTNSTITINGTAVALGGSTTLNIDNGTVTPDVDRVVRRSVQGWIYATDIIANGRIYGSLSGTVTGNTSGTHTGPVIGNVTGVASGNVARTGDSMSGFLTLSANPTNNLHAATKQYVDQRTTPYIITSGASHTASFSNIVGQFNNEANFFDVFPPAGKFMSNLVAFIPSIHVIHFSGIVDGNDSLRCTYSYFNDRVRVYVQNTEQRSHPAANWLAVWS